MTLRRIVATLLMTMLTTGPMLAQTPVTGGIAGRATDEARRPYSDYTVQLRDVATGQIVSTQPLDVQGAFAFANLDMSKRYLVELFNTERNRVVCSEGPYSLTAGAGTNQGQVNIDCGATPAALWLLVAGAGTAAAIATTTASPSR